MQQTFIASDMPTSPSVTLSSIEANQDLRDHLEQVRQKLETLKKNLTDSSEKIKSNLESRSLLQPDAIDYGAASIYIIEAFNGMINTPLDLLKSVGVYMSLSFLAKILPRRTAANKLKNQALALQGATLLLEELNEILRQHQTFTQILHSELTEGIMDEPAYLEAMSGAFNRLNELSTKAVSNHRSAFEGLHPVVKEFPFASTLSKHLLTFLDTRIRTANSLEDLAPIQEQLLADPAYLTDRRAWEALDLIEKKVVRDVYSGLSFLANTEKEKIQYLKQLKSHIPSGHIYLTEVLKLPGLAENIANFKKTTQEAMFATGNRLVAWRKLILTTTPNIKYAALSLYMEAVQDDAELSKDEKQTLTLEFRAAMEGQLAFTKAEIYRELFPKYRTQSGHSLEDEAKIRRKDKSELSFESIYGAFTVEGEEAAKFKAGLVETINNWSRAPKPAEVQNHSPSR